MTDPTAAQAHIDTHIDSLEGDLGIPKGFVEALVKEDDWSFIVKTHALVEAVLTQLLVVAINCNAVEDNIATLPMRTKLDFAEKLELIDGRERACIQSLLSLRNKLAHNISYVQFDLKKFITSLEPGKRRELALTFFPYRGDEIAVKVESREIPIETLFVAAPKWCIHVAVVMIVSLVSQKKANEVVRRDLNMRLIEFAQKLFQQLPVPKLDE